MNWHVLTVFDSIKKLSSDPDSGLSAKEASKRLLEYGKNQLDSKKKSGFLKKFFMQFNDFMILILIFAAILSFIMSIISGDADFVDPLAILAIIILNAALGTVQEAKAEKAIDALKKMSSPTAKVKRDGKIQHVPTEEIVPGDILIFTAGAKVSADCRLIESNSLEVDESSLTGESFLIEKDFRLNLDPLTPLADRKNMVFSGSSIISGKGEGIVVATGMNTELGKIASLIIESEEIKTPLQKRLEKIGKTLGILSLFICVIIFFIGILKHYPPFEMFMMSVSLAVAAIPEGLPAIVTIMLAIGVQSMAKKNAIVRNLPAVETLGNASVICTDKTGTLTTNKMIVRDSFSEDDGLLFKYAALCSDSESSGNQNPTELAILGHLKSQSQNKTRLDKLFPRISEIPFDSDKKFMTTCHKSGDGFLVISKGAPDILIKYSQSYHKNSGPVPFDSALKNKILNQNITMANNSLRVIAVAYKSQNTSDFSTDNLTFLGLIGLQDPPRPEAKDAIKSCHSAGIKVVMITGDHINTAKSIGTEIGLLKDGQKAITGAELDEISQQKLEQSISDYSIFARVTPKHKVRIVNAWQKQGKVVAMTGDGVNDAPALKKADIGCSMGITGTDVAKSASDIILVDDNFATIVSAVKKGREIYDNLKKSVKFLLSSNIGEIVTVFIGLLFGWKSPLFPIQLLWINLVTDSLPAIALGLDPPADEIMKKKPAKAQENIFNKSMWIDIFLEGTLIGALAVLAYAIGMIFFESVTIGRTMAFSVLGISQLLHAFNMRSEGSILNRELFKNKFLIYAFLSGVILQVIAVTFLSPLFKTVPLSIYQWLVCLGLSLLPIPIVELQKMCSGK